MPGEWGFSASKLSNYARLKIQMPPDGSDVEHDLIMEGGTISGQVVGEAGKPVPGAQVSIKSKEGYGSGNMETDANGNFKFKFPEGNYEVRATDETAGNSAIQNIFCPPTGNAAPVKLILKTDPATITCTVLSILDGMPAENAYATLKSGENLSSIGSSTSNETGDAVIKNVTPGDYTLTVGAYGLEQIKRPITVEFGQQLTFTDVLSPASSVNATVVDSNGYLAKNATVTLTPLDSSSRDTGKTEVTDDSGTAKFPSVLYGNYSLHVSLHEGPMGTVTISTNNQKNVLVRLVIPAQE